MLGGDMASFAARLSIGRWATFWRRASVLTDRQRIGSEYVNTIIAIDENVEMALARTAIRIPPSHGLLFVRMYK